MKKYIVNLVIPVLTLCSMFACSKWTEPEPAFSYVPEGKSDEYYAALRDWKYNDKHPRTFGWFGNWTGKGASGQNRLMGLPDSIDFVSMWGNWWGLSPEQMADKQAAKDIKGLRVKICFIVANIGDQVTPKYVRVAKTDPETGKDYWEVNGVKYAKEQDAVNAFWGWPKENPTEEQIEGAIRKFTSAIADTIVKYDFDGFDLDLETHFGAPGNIASYKDRLTIFLDEMSKTCGPLSGTSRLLCVDGEPNILDPKCAKMINYFILQAYYASSYSSIDAGGGFTPRVQEVVDNYTEYFRDELGYAEPVKEIISRIIICEDFEQNPALGGKMGTFTTRDGRKLPPIWGMADYFSIDGYQIGGAGLFHMEYDYGNTYSSIMDAQKDKGMDLSPAKGTGEICYGYLNGVIRLLHNPVNPAAKEQPVE